MIKLSNPLLLQTLRINLRLVPTLLLAAAVPFTVYLSLQRQDIRQRAEQGEKQEEQEQPPSEFRSNELLVKFKREARGKIKENPQDTGIESVNQTFKQVHAKKFERVAKIGKNSKADAEVFSWYVVTLDGFPEKAAGKLDKAYLTVQANQADKPTLRGNPHALDNLQRAITTLTDDPNVETVDLNYIVTTQAVPNDPYYSSIGSWGQTYPDLWGIKKINPESAWDQTTGSQSIIVADIDTGVDRNHQDLAQNMWVNTAENPNNGIDDDQNGYVDDYYGWDFHNNDNDPMDDHGHGTHTVGTIAATGNNGEGVVGVNWTSKIMALKFLDNQGSGNTYNGIKALQYAADMGAKVSSNSWGCDCNSAAMDDAIKYEHDRGMVMVVAAGNSNRDSLDFSPASADYAITVAASDSNDTKASFSNWGEKIDVAAPGVDILSTRASNNPMCTSARTVGTNYCRVSGTSMATPHVAGLAALLFTKNPSLTNEEVRQIIRNGADDLGTSGKDSSFGFGRINANSSITLAPLSPLAPVITSPSSRTKIFGSSMNVMGKIPGNNFSSYKIELGAGRAPSSWTTIGTGNSQPTADSVLATFDTTQFPENKYIIRLTATDSSGKNYLFQTHDIEIDNFDAVISFPAGLVSLGSIDIMGTAQTKNNLAFANYKIEWGVGSTWSTAGVTLVNGGTQPILNGKLATWDTSNLTPGLTYALRLTVTATNGASYQITTSVKADKDLVKGWPKLFITQVFGGANTSPALVDIDNDGSKEIIIAAPDGTVNAFKKDGNSLAGFPFIAAAGDVFASWDGITVADLDNDGKKEIIADTFYGAKMYIIKSDGTLYPGWPRAIGPGGGIRRSPTVADIDNDGVKDIVFIDIKTWVSNTDATLHAYHLDGTELTSFPKKFVLPPIGLGDGYIFPSDSSGLVVADLDFDGSVELAWSYSNRIYLHDNAGNILPGWPISVPNYNGKIMVFESPLSAGDIDGDGKLELFSMSSASCSTTSYTCYLGSDTVFYGFRKDGAVLSGWPRTTLTDGLKSYGSYGGAAPVLVDVDNDGNDEAVVSAQKLAIFDLEGQKTLQPVTTYSAPGTADVDGDGKVEFIMSYYNLVGIYNDDGTKYWDQTASNVMFNTPGVLSDIDNNGKIEFAVISRPYTAESGLNLIAYLWEIPAPSASSQYEWPMFGHNPARSGRLILGPQPPTPTLGAPTPTALPTVTSSPSATPLPTNTPTPTTTPTPTQAADTIRPIVSITSPLDNAVIARNSTITILASASDNVGVTRVEFYVNNKLICSDTTLGYTCSWKVPGKPNTTYKLSAIAVDTSNNSATTSITIKVQ